MFKVLNKLLVGSMYCVSVEGDILLLKNGLMLTDEKKIFLKLRQSLCYIIFALLKDN